MMEVFDIPVSREIQSLAAPIIWNGNAFTVTHLVHWLGDVVSLGPFNVSMKQKTDGLVFGLK